MCCILHVPQVTVAIVQYGYDPMDFSLAPVMGLQAELSTRSSMSHPIPDSEPQRSMLKGPLEQI